MAQEWVEANSVLVIGSETPLSTGQRKPRARRIEVSPKDVGLVEAQAELIDLGTRRHFNRYGLTRTVKGALGEDLIEGRKNPGATG